MGISSLLPPSDFKRTRPQKLTDIQKMPSTEAKQITPQNKYLIGFPPTFKIENIYMQRLQNSQDPIEQLADLKLLENSSKLGKSNPKDTYASRIQ